MKMLIELALHLPLCLVACLMLHMLECNSPLFRKFTHLEWLKKSNKPEGDCCGNES
jgi:hypothetical protein